MVSLIKSATSWLGSATKSTSSISGGAAENQRLREDLALAHRALAYYSLHEGIENQISVRAPARSADQEVMLIIPHVLHWSQVTASSFLGVDFETGELVEGAGKIHTFTTDIHRAIHKAKAPEGYTCVVHTHQTYATAIACCHGKLKHYHQNSLRFHNRIGYDEPWVIPSDDEGKRIADTFIGKSICFQGNHGVTVCGKRICDAFDDTYFLEQACKAQVLAMSTGMEPVAISDETAVAALAADDYEEDADHREAHFEAMRAVIARMEPDYRS